MNRFSHEALWKFSVSDLKSLKFREELMGDIHVHTNTQADWKDL